MTKEELINNINDLVEFAINGRTICDNITFKGHPGFYLLHSKEEFDNKLKSIIIDKDTYNKYDFYYYVNYMFKYMLNQFDSHTKIDFIEQVFMPIIIKIVDDIPYIIKGVNVEPGSILKRINGVDIEVVFKELSNIISSPSKSFLNNELEVNLRKVKVLKSLPCLNIGDTITYTTDKGDYTYDIHNFERFKDNSRKENYSLEVKDNTAIITYNACRDLDRMIELVNKLKSLNNIDNYIVDLRNNCGGNSGINKPLVDFLKDKNTVVLSNENVFSSGIMCLVDLKNNGALTVGTGPSATLSSFGNCVMKKEYEDLRFLGSTTYWYYDDNYKCHGYVKDEFDEILKENPHIMDLKFFNVDEEIKLTIDNYLNNQDFILEYALSLFKKKNSR